MEHDLERKTTIRTKLGPDAISSTGARKFDQTFMEFLLFECYHTKYVRFQQDANKTPNLLKWSHRRRLPRTEGQNFLGGHLALPLGPRDGRLNLLPNALQPMSGSAIDVLHAGHRTTAVSWKRFASRREDRRLWTCLLSSPPGIQLQAWSPCPSSWTIQIRLRL